MRIIKKKVYTAQELYNQFPQSFEKAKYAHRYYTEGTISDAMESIKKCLKYFDACLKDYSIDISYPANSNFTIEHNINGEITGVRLFKYLQNNYPELLGNYWFTFTPSGLCYDEDFAKPFSDFMKKPCQQTNINKLLENAVNAIISAANKDYEYETSNEGFMEIANDLCLEFYEDGRLV